MYQSIQIIQYIVLIYTKKMDFLRDKDDRHVKSPKFRHAPAFAGASSAKAGIQKYLKIRDPRLPGCVTIMDFAFYPQKWPI